MVGGVSLLQKDRWSIGIYAGSSPFDLGQPGDARNPVLTAADVSDVQADFVADPFMVRENSTWYLFFEVFNKQTQQGDIGLATSPDGLDWTYKGIVLDEQFHLSYPYVFKWDGEYYMIPESKRNKSIRLYKATGFPTKWSFEKTLLQGDYQDSSVFRSDGRWWMFTSDRDDRLYLYYADELGGPWSAHPENPIVENDKNIARPGGRVMEYNGSIIRFAQDDFPIYGNRVWAFAITRLTTSGYQEELMPLNPVLKPGNWSWNSQGMHTIDAHEVREGYWIAAVDGK
jgi:hypothetical protein